MPEEADVERVEDRDTQAAGDERADGRRHRRIHQKGALDSSRREDLIKRLPHMRVASERDEALARKVDGPQFTPLRQRMARRQDADELPPANRGLRQLGMLDRM